jgi:hypothetical protein
MLRHVGAALPALVKAKRHGHNQAGAEIDIRGLVVLWQPVNFRQGRAGHWHEQTGTADGTVKRPGQTHANHPESLDQLRRSPERPQRLVPGEHM